MFGPVTKHPNSVASYVSSRGAKFSLLQRKVRKTREGFQFGIFGDCLETPLAV